MGLGVSLWLIVTEEGITKTIVLGNSLSMGMDREDTWYLGRIKDWKNIHRTGS